MKEAKRVRHDDLVAIDKKLGKAKKGQAEFRVACKGQFSMSTYFK